VNYFKLSDQKLIELIQSDPQIHFEGLLSRYENQVFIYALRLLNYNIQNTEDVCSEVWFKCYKSILAFNPNKKFISWIYQITHNQAIDYMRKHSKIYTQNIDTTPDLFYIPAKFQKSQNYQNLTKLLTKLKPNDRAILTLYYLEEKSIPEIAQILKIFPKLASLKLFRAKSRAQKLAKSYNQKITLQ
jgi:RNA polymerase sigma-70 factor, ECF subfamily